MMNFLTHAGMIKDAVVDTVKLVKGRHDNKANQSITLTKN